MKRQSGKQPGQRIRRVIVGLLLVIVLVHRLLTARLNIRSVVSVHQPSSRLECGTSYVEQIDDQWRHRLGRYPIDSLGVVEDVFIRRPEFSVPGTDKSILSNQIDRASMPVARA